MRGGKKDKNGAGVWNVDVVDDTRRQNNMLIQENTTEGEGDRQGANREGDQVKQPFKGKSTRGVTTNPRSNPPNSGKVGSVGLLERPIRKRTGRVRGLKTAAERRNRSIRETKCQGEKKGNRKNMVNPNTKRFQRKEYHEVGGGGV